MPRRKVKLDTKVTVMREALRLMDVEALRRKHRLSKQALYNWYQRVLDALPEILSDTLPGPKPHAAAPPESPAAPPFESGAGAADE